MNTNFAVETANDSKGGFETFEAACDKAKRNSEAMPGVRFTATDREQPTDGCAAKLIREESYFTLGFEPVK